MEEQNSVKLKTGNYPFLPIKAITSICFLEILLSIIIWLSFLILSTAKYQHVSSFQDHLPAIDIVTQALQHSIMASAVQLFFSPDLYHIHFYTVFYIRTIHMCPSIDFKWLYGTYCVLLTIIFIFLYLVDTTGLRQSVLSNSWEIIRYQVQYFQKAILIHNIVFRQLEIILGLAVDIYHRFS